jgi:hypothetical protein
MKEGTIVQCINDNGFPKWYYPSFIWPIKNEIYIVREYKEFEVGDDAILLEEIINPAIIPYTKNNSKGLFEPYFIISRFRILHKPICLAELMSKENIIELV